MIPFRRACSVGAATGCALLPALPASAQTALDFADPVVYDLGEVIFPNSIDAGDLNEDGRVDLVLAARNNEGMMPIFFQQPDGTFAPPVFLEMPGQTNWAAVRDFDGDGHLDLALSHRSGLGRVSLLCGDGTGAFAEPVDTSTGRSPNLILTEDLDGDGDLDLVTLDWGSWDLTVMHNVAGSFVRVQQPRINRAASPSAYAIWAAADDFDGDGDIDLALSGVNTAGFITLLDNRGDGTFLTARQLALPGLEEDEVVATMASADFDDDGDIDLVTKAGGIDFLDRLIILANDGSARFSVAAEIPLIGSLGGSPWDTRTADFDADGHLDLAWVTHSLSSRRVAFLTDQGPGGPAFDMPEQTFFLDGFPRALVAVDLDNDQDLDLAVANIGSHTMAVLENGAPPAPAAGPPQRTGRRSGVTAPPGIEALAHFGAPVRGGRTPLAAGGPCGDPEAGDCFEPNGTPGCEEEACCTSVCAVDPFCCDSEWDQNCADIALEECEMPACPGKFSCFETHVEEGCDDLACCELVTLLDGFCTGFWDQLCVDQASALCALEPCVLEPCPQGAIVEPETINCLDAANDGCNLLAGPAFTPVSCGDTICGTTWTLAKRDTDWYEIDVSGREVVTWEVASEFPAELLIVSGSCTDTYTVAAAAYGAACAPASVSLALDPGTYYLFVAPGIEARPIARGIGCLDDKGELIEGGAFTNRYTATVSCAPACVADIDGDGAVSTADLLALIAAWGDGPGSPADFDGNGVVDTADMLFLLTAWGPCR